VATAKLLSVGIKDVFPWFDALKMILLNVAFGAVFVGIKYIVPLEKYVAIAPKGGLDGSAVESVILAAVWVMIYFAIMLKPIKRRWNALKVKD